MHKLERLILESYGQLLTEMDGGRLFDYFNNKGYDITERSSDGGNPGFEGYMVSKGEGRSPQAVIFQHNKDTDEFTISRISGYRIDQDKAIKAGMREKSSSAVAGIDGYMTDGNYTPVNIDAEDLKDIVDHVMTGLEREAEAQRDFYAKRGPVSGTIDEVLSYAFSEYDFIIKDDAYKAEVEAKIKKELKKVQSEPLEIPEKDLEAIIKNAENYFAKEARKREKANRNPKKIKSTEFAQFAADYYTEEYYPDKYGKDYPDKRGDMKAIQTGYTPAQAERFRRSDVVPFLIDYGVKGNDGKTIGLYNMPDDYYTMDAEEFNKKYEVYKRREIKRRNDRLKDPDFPIEKLQDKPGGPLKLQKDFYEIRAWEFDKIYGKGGEIEDDDFDIEDYSRLGFLNEEIPDGKKRDVTNINKLPANYKKKLIDRYGEPFMDGKYDFISSDMDTYFKAYDRNEETGSTSHKIVKLPSFFKLYQDMVDIIEDIKTLMRSPEIRKDEAARELFELLKSNYRQLQKYLRTERPEQYDLMKMRRATYEAVRKLQEMYPVAGNDAKERFKTNHDAYKKANLKESLLDELNEQEPEPEEPADEKAPEETILEDATDQILSKFPTLKANIIKLQTEDFKEFVDTIDWISPRPTTFRVNLKNGQDYILKWTGTGFEAQIMGKRYYLNKIEDYQNALDKLNILYKEGPMSGAGEGEPADTDTGGTGGGGGGDFPGDDAAGGGGDFGGGDDEGGGDEFGGGGADLGDEPIDFEEPGEEPEA